MQGTVLFALQCMSQHRLTGFLNILYKGSAFGLSSALAKGSSGQDLSLFTRLGAALKVS